MSSKQFNLEISSLVIPLKKPQEEKQFSRVTFSGFQPFRKLGNSYIIAVGGAGSSALPAFESGM